MAGRHEATLSHTVSTARKTVACVSRPDGGSRIGSAKVTTDGLKPRHPSGKVPREQEDTRLTVLSTSPRAREPGRHAALQHPTAAELWRMQRKCAGHIDEDDPSRSRARQHLPEHGHAATQPRQQMAECSNAHTAVEARRGRVIKAAHSKSVSTGKQSKVD